jgi:hypothetical protein
MRTNNTVFQAVMNATSDYRNEVLSRKISAFEQTMERKASDFDIKIMELEMVYDLARAIGKYVLPSDEVAGDCRAGMDCGKLTVRIMVQRDSSVHSFATDVIFAGGYNIQCLHLRYLVYTTLPMIGKSEDAKAINELIKGMKKQERISADIEREQNRLDGMVQFIEKYSEMSEDEMLQGYLSAGAGLGCDLTYKMLAEYKWEKLIPEAKERIGSKDAYEMEQIEIVYKYAVTRRIEDVIRNRAAIKQLHKRIEKLQQKLELLQQAD